MVRASLVLNIPAAMLIFIGILSLQTWLTAYYHFVNQDTRSFTRYACEVHPRGDHLVRQDIDDDPAKAIPCLCSSLFGCSSVSDVESRLSWRITESSIYIVAGAGLLGAFFVMRKYLKTHGILGNRPRTISIIGSIFAVLSIISLLVPIMIGTGSAWAGLDMVRDFPYIAYFTYYGLVMPFAALAIAIGIFVLERRRWLWKVSISFLIFSLAMIFVSMDYHQLLNPFPWYHRHVSLALIFVGLYFLFTPETRNYYRHHYQAKPSIA